MKTTRWILFLLLVISTLPFLSLALFSLGPPLPILTFRISFVLLALILYYVAFRVWTQVNAGSESVPVWQTGVPIWFLLTVTVAAMLFMFRMAIMQEGMIDAIAMWNGKARDYFEIFRRGMKFQLVGSYWYHPGYPVFHPLLLAGVSSVVGLWSSLNHQGLALFYLLLTALIFYGFWWEHADQVRFKLFPRSLQESGPLFFSVFFLSAGFLYFGAESTADLPLSVYFLGLHFLLRLLARDPRNWITAITMGLVGGALLNTKLEGVVLVAVFFASFAHLAYRYPALRRSLVLIGASILPALLFFIFYKLNAPEAFQEDYHLQEGKGLSLLFASMMDWHRYGNLLLLFFSYQVMAFGCAPIVGAVHVFRCHRKRMIWLVPSLLALTAYEAIFLIKPGDFWFNVNGAYQRLMLQQSPAFFYAIFQGMYDDFLPESEENIRTIES